MEVPLVLHTRAEDIPSQPPTNSMPSKIANSSSNILDYLCGQKELSQISNDESEKQQNNNEMHKILNPDGITQTNDINYLSLKSEIDSFVKALDNRLNAQRTQIQTMKNECEQAKKHTDANLSAASPTLVCRSGDLSRARIEIDNLALLIERVAKKTPQSHSSSSSLSKSMNNTQSINQKYLTRNTNKPTNEKFLSTSTKSENLGSWHIHAAEMKARMISSSIDTSIQNKQLAYETSKTPSTNKEPIPYEGPLLDEEDDEENLIVI